MMKMQENKLENDHCGKVSIVVPVYNQERYLDVSIPSMQKQSYKNIEIVLVNDGSTDQSDVILQRYVKEDNRIKVIEKENGGLVDATICGVENSIGEFIVFLDPDDRIGVDFIQSFMNHMKPEYDFVAAGIYYENQGEITPATLEKDAVYSINEMPWLRKHYLLNENSSMPAQNIFHARWNKLYRAQCVKQVVQQFKKYKGVTMGEDSVFTYLFLNCCRGGMALSNPNSYYYNVGNQNSMTNNASIDNYINKVEFVFEEYVKLMSDNNDSTEQAYMLYYMLSMSLFNKVKKSDREEFIHVYKKFYRRNNYRKSLRFLIKKEKNLKRKMGLIAKLIVPFPKLFLMISSI